MQRRQIREHQKLVNLVAERLVLHACSPCVWRTGTVWFHCSKRHSKLNSTVPRIAREMAAAYRASEKMAQRSRPRGKPGLSSYITNKWIVPRQRNASDRSEGPWARCIIKTCRHGGIMTHRKVEYTRRDNSFFPRSSWISRRFGIARVTADPADIFSCQCSGCTPNDTAA